MTDSVEDRSVLDHYRNQAQDHGLEPSSTMLDQRTRAMETEAILACIARVVEVAPGPVGLLEVGSGNGFLLQSLRDRFPALRLTGIDYSPDMVRLASSRALDDCEIQQGDVRALAFSSDQFDIVVSERCLINLLDSSWQTDALREIHRVLKPGGHLVLIEAFTDGAGNLDRARIEVGLAETTIPSHNLWFDKAHFMSIVDDLYTEEDSEGVPPPNFLSTHYFISRVLYPSITKREVLYDTEFVKFFGFLPPVGNYSPIQLYFFRKLAIPDHASPD